MTAKEMFLENDCRWSETSWGIWIDTNASCEPGCERLCMIDKKEKKIIWQRDNAEIILESKIKKAFRQLIKELGWDNE